MSNAPLFPSSRRLLAALVALLRNRLDILVTELEEEKLRLSAILLFGAMAVFFLLFSLLFLAFFLVAAFWEQRLWILGLGAFAFLGLGLWAFLRVAAELGRRSRFLSMSLDELKKDWHALRREDQA